MKRFTIPLIAALVAIVATGSLAFTKPYTAENWTAAVELGLVEGDASYYYDGKATPDEYYHALLTAILAVNEGRSHIPTTTTQPPTTTTQPPTTTTSSTTSSTTTTAPVATTTVPTTTTVAPTTTAPTTTTAPPSGNVVNLSGVNNGYSIRPLANTTYLCAPGTVLDGQGVAQYAFRGSAVNVTIDGCEVRNYRNGQQQGAIHAEPGGNGWVVINNEVHHNWGVGIQIKANTARIANNYVHHQNQLGVAAQGNDIVFEDNEVSYNNYNVDFSWGWEAGGSKFWDTNRLIVRNNHFHNNHGPGIWTDYNNINTLIEGNLVEDNWANGIFHEISYDAVIRNNTVRRNGFGHQAWLWGAGILIATSSNVEIYDNLVEDNYNGITVTQQNRTASTGYVMRYGPWKAYNNVFHGNVVKGGSSGVVRDNGDNTVFTNNTFYGNTYDANHRFAWNNTWGNAAWWRGFHPNDAV